MDGLVVLALVVALALCLLPGVMAWINYASRTQPTTEKKAAVKRQLQAAHIASK